MRSRMLLGVTVFGALTVGVGFVVPAGATQHASAARLKQLAQVKVPLPAPGHAAIVAVTLKVTAPKGKSVGSLSVGVANAAQVKSADADAVAALPPASHKRSATLTIYVAMYRGNLAAPHRRASAASAGSMAMPILGPADNFRPYGRIRLNQAECPSLAKSSHGNLLQDLPRENYKALVQITVGEKPEQQWDEDTYADCGSQGAEKPDDGDS